MTRLTRKDLADPAMVAKLAKAAGTTADKLQVLAATAE